jgi:hypothetical protein
VASTGTRRQAPNGNLIAESVPEEQQEGAEPETTRLRLMMRHPLAHRFVAGIRGVDIARWRDKRVPRVTPATVKRDLVCLATSSR